jgi:photosystem II stability/assembly factor-like uncharacterized protein
MIKSIQYLPFLLTLLSLDFTISQQDIWEQTAGPVNGTVWAIGIDRDDVIFAGDDAVLYTSKDNGDNWHLVADWSTVAVEIVSIVFNDSGHIYVGTFGGNGVYRSTNGGGDWLSSNFQLPGVNTVAVGYDGDIIAGTMTGVWISTDGGNEWELRDNGFPEPTIILSAFVDDLNYYFVGTYSGQDAIYKSTDLGMSWIASGPPLYWFAIISSINSSINTLFASGLDNPLIYRSTNNGDSWEYFSNGLPFTSSDFVVISNNMDHLFTGSSSFGVYKSIDNGETWTDFNSGLFNDNILSLGINSKGILFAGTSSDGVFRTVQSTTSVEILSETIPTRNFLLQNYPNPFNPSTTINYTIKKSGNVALKVYGVLGNEIITLVNEEKPVGKYEVEFNAATLSSGLYFYKLTSGEFSSAKKMILIK